MSIIPALSAPPQVAAPTATRIPDHVPATENFPGPSQAGVPAGSTVTLDPGSGRVVQEYFDATGALTSTIPSRQQLETYRLAALAGQKAG